LVFLPRSFNLKSVIGWLREIALPLHLPLSCQVANLLAEKASLRLFAFPEAPTNSTDTFSRSTDEQHGQGRERPTNYKQAPHG